MNYSSDLQKRKRILLSHGIEEFPIPCPSQPLGGGQAYSWWQEAPLGSIMRTDSRLPLGFNDQYVKYRSSQATLPGTVPLGIIKKMALERQDKKNVSKGKNKPAEHSANVDFEKAVNPHVLTSHICW